jgi:hypothetical protein
MNNKQVMLEKLLEAISSFDDFHEPPEQVVGQFALWLGQVSSALEGAGMDLELRTWNESLENVRFSAEDSSLYAQMTTSKAILIGILDRVSGGQPSSELFPLSIVEGTPDYIQKVALQANGCYERGWYDCSAVMMRRLIETLIIECFEKHGIESKIKNSDGNYFFLGELIPRFLSETWSISRNTKNSLPKLKDVKDLGDMAAHSRSFLATKSDIDKYSKDFRIVLQELVFLSEKLSH